MYDANTYPINADVNPVASTYTKNWLTCEEVQAYSGLSKSFLYRNRHGAHGEVIPYASIGRRILYNKDDIDEFLRQSGWYAAYGAAYADAVSDYDGDAAGEYDGAEAERDVIGTSVGADGEVDAGEGSVAGCFAGVDLAGFDTAPAAASSVPPAKEAGSAAYDSGNTGASESSADTEEKGAI